MSSSLMRTPEFDNYVVSGVLGEGGMGIVFLAHDRRTDLSVAIKVMSKSLQDPELQARFVKENQILSSLNNRNIVRCYEITRSREGLPSIVMEYLRGVDLSAFETKPFPELLPLMVQSAMGLGYLKERNILHRDLSSNNIIVVLQNERRLVKIVDFGVAKILEESTEGGTELTHTGEFLGKFAFSSPELLMLTGADWRSDIYSLGVIFFRLLTGRRPIEVTNPRSYLEWVAAHQRENSLDFGVRPGNPPIPEAFGVLVRRMLARRREDRPQTYEEIIESLTAVQRRAQEEGLEPDPTAASTLPTPPAKAQAARSGSAAGSPAGGDSGGTPSGAPSFVITRGAGGGGQFTDAVTSASTTPVGVTVPAGPAEEQPVILRGSDYMQEMQSLELPTRPVRAAAHPVRTAKRPPGSTGSKTSSYKRPVAKKSHTGAVVGVAVVVLIAAAGAAAWWFFLGPGAVRPAALVGRDLPSVREAPPAVPPPLEHAPLKPVPPAKPAVRAGSGDEPSEEGGGGLSVEARSLTSSNLVGFWASATGTSSAGSTALLLLKFERPVNVVGLAKGHLVKARTLRSSSITGLEGVDVSLFPPDNPKGATELRFAIPGSFEPGDTRLKEFSLMELRLGAIVLEGRRMNVIGN